MFISNSLIRYNYNYYRKGSVALSNDKSKFFSVDYEYNRGLYLIDISDLNNLVVEQIMDERIQSVVISADNKRAFIKSRGVEEYFLTIMDISDILNPVEISQTSVANFNNMQLSKDEIKLYVTYVGDNNGLGVIDISDIAHPIVSTKIRTAGNAVDLILSEDEQTAYMTDSKGGLQIIDISDTNEFKLLGVYITEGLVEKIHLFNDETKIYLTVKYSPFGENIKEGHIHIVDIIDKSNPTLLAKVNLNYQPIEAFIFTSDETKMIVSGNINYRIYENIGDFEELRFLGETSEGKLVTSDELTLTKDETIMLATSYYHIYIIDISDPTNPIIIKKIQLNLFFESV